jgi:hypothetical protein
MQDANKNAPKILEAIATLGLADPSHVAFAMLGLPSALQKGATGACASLRPVATRLLSRKISCDLRLEMARMRAASAHPDLITTVADWSAPPADLLPLLLALDDAPEGQWAGAARLAGICRGWLAAVRQWRANERCIVLQGPDDEAVRIVARDAPDVVELRLLPDSERAMLRLTDNGMTWLACGCRQLQRLCLRHCVLLSPRGLHSLASLVDLRDLDLAGSTGGWAAKRSSNDDGTTTTASAGSTGSDCTFIPYFEGDHNDLPVSVVWVHQQWQASAAMLGRSVLLSHLSRLVLFAHQYRDLKHLDVIRHESPGQKVRCELISCGCDRCRTLPQREASSFGTWRLLQSSAVQ